MVERDNELKGTTFTISVLHLSDGNPDRIRQLLEAKVAQAPQFFNCAPLVLNVERLEAIPDFEQLRELVESEDFVLVGITGARDEAMKTAAKAAGLAVMVSGKSRKAEPEPTPPAPEPKPVEAAPVPPVPAPVEASKVHVGPVRSGQQIYAAGTSLVVLGVHRDGGFSEYAAVPAKNAWPIPDDIPDKHAVMVEPFTIAANVTGQANPIEQDVALVYGAGPMGLVTVQALKGVYKVKQVIVVDRIDERLKMAQRSGADWVLNNGERSLQAALDEKGIKPTLIIDAACHPSILQEAITLASPAARIVLMGFSSEPSHIVQQGITGKELAIFSSRLNANKFPVVIDWLKKGLIDPEKLITHTFDYHHVTDALELFEKDQRQCCKVLLTFGQ